MGKSISNNEYSYELQKYYLELMMSDAEVFVRLQNIFDAKNFHPDLIETADFINKYTLKYKALPGFDQIEAMTKVRLEEPGAVGKDKYEWLMDDFEQFTIQKSAERAVIAAMKKLDAGDHNILADIKAATEISLTRDMGTNYFENPRQRLEKIRTMNGQCSTGWAALDRKLYGGFNRGELQIFAGGSGSGKSLFMQNLSVNYIEQKLNVIYITLELDEELTAKRIDSMITGVASNQIYKNLDDVNLKVSIKGKTSGKLQIKYMPAQSNVNDIRSFVREWETKTDAKVDVLCIDYLDLLMPVSARVSPSDLFVKDKYVSEELRNLAKELDVITITASQLNRSAVDEVEFNHSMISGGISKINTADNVFGIFTSRSMMERGKYQIQLMKTRSSSGVGQKIDLDFNIETLRITDSADVDGSDLSDPVNSANRILHNVRSGNVPKAQTESNKVNALLNKIKQGK